MNDTPLAQALFNDRSFFARETQVADVLGKPSASLMDRLVGIGIPYALLPECYGGANYGYFQEYTLIKTATSIAPSLGWIVFQLCGNPPRVLSFYDDADVRCLIEQASQDLIVAYDTNPRVATAKCLEGGFELSGTWQYATLSQVANFFAIPFLDPLTGVERCYLANTEQVNVDTHYTSDGLRGTSTTSFTIKGSIKAEIGQCPTADYNNSLFATEYRMARAPVKHVAWSIGLWSGLLSYLQTQKMNANAQALIERDLERLAMVEDQLTARMQELQTLVADGFESENFTLAQIKMQELKQISVRLQSWVLETTISFHLAAPGQALDDSSTLYRWVRHNLTGSLHGAVRECTNSWSWGELSSPRYVNLMADLGT